MPMGLYTKLAHTNIFYAHAHTWGNTSFTQTANICVASMHQSSYIYPLCIILVILITYTCKMSKCCSNWAMLAQLSNNYSNWAMGKVSWNEDDWQIGDIIMLLWFVCVSSYAGMLYNASIFTKHKHFKNVTLRVQKHLNEQYYQMVQLVDLQWYKAL